MLRIILENLSLVGVGLACFILGVFVSSQRLKDFFRGVPADLRRVMAETEARTLKAVEDAKAKAIADANKKIVVAAPAPAPVLTEPTTAGTPTPGALA